MRLIYSIFAWIVALPVTLFFSTTTFLAAVISPRTEAAMKSAGMWARCCMMLGRLKVRVEGLDDLPIGQYVIMCNHESALDIPLLLSALPTGFKARFMAKKSLFLIPFFGWALRAMGFIPVDRQHRATASRSFGEAIEQLELGRSILVFPEEGRSRDGELLDFMRGGFLLALKTGVSILPVGLDGSIEAMPSDQLVFNPGEIVLRFGTPIPTAGLKVSARRRLMAEAEAQIRDLCDPQEEAVSSGRSR